MQCCLVFSAPALNLIVALFQPGRSHLLPIRSGNVAVTDLRVKIMGVVSTTKVSNIFTIPQDTFQPQQAHLVINGETDFLFSRSLFPLGFQGGSAKEVGVSLQFAGEEEPSLQWCVIHPHLLVPVGVALLNAETVDGAVAGVHHSKLLASLSQCQVYRNTAVTWNVQLPAKLPYKADPQCSYLMTRNLDHLVGGEWGAKIVQRCVSQLLKDVPGGRALKAEHPHLLAPVLQCHVKTPILNCTLDVGKVLVGSTASGSNVKATTLKGRISTGARSCTDDRDGEVSLNSSAFVEHTRVDRLPLRSCHRSCEDPIDGSLCIWPGQVELPKVGHVEEACGGASRKALRPDVLLNLGMVECVVKLEAFFVSILLICQIVVGPVPIVRLDWSGAVLGKPSRTLPSKPFLINTASSFQDLMQRILFHVSSCQRFVMREHHGVVLGVSLVTPLVDPFFIL